MFKNYIKIAFRNLLRNKGFSTINIAGLAVGMAIFVSLITVSFQAVKAALANPVKSLRTE